MAALTGRDTHEFTAAAGTRVHAAVPGRTSVREVVCLPGLGCSHRYYLPLAPQLAPAVRVVAVDLPGFGRTPCPVGRWTCGVCPGRWPTGWL
jgi:pimeloyl-ACP methyl ester carboxylesterase